MTTIATICARGGSTGLPRKNVLPLLGKPLIVWTIEQALAVPSIDATFVSTDDEEIAAVAEAAGARVLGRRPAHLATAEAPKIPVIQHLVEQVESTGLLVDRIVDLDPTSPLRTVSDIEACIGLLTSEVDTVITGFPSDKNPYFNMVEEQPDGNYRVVKQTAAIVTSRQQAPAVYSMNASIYVWHRRTLGLGLWGGRVRLHPMPRDRSIDIDSRLDFRLVELILQERLGSG